MFQYGKTFKLIRESKNLSQSYVARDIIARPTLSLFENGKRDICLNEFSLLLIRLGVTHEEFFYMVHLDSQFYKEYFKLYEIVKGKFHRLPLKEINGLLDSFSNEYIKTQDIKYYIAYLQIKVISEEYFLRLFDEGRFLKEKDIISDFLEGIEIWSHFEIQTFNNCLYLFDKNTAYNYYNKLITDNDIQMCIINEEEKKNFYTKLIVIALVDRDMKLLPRLLKEFKDLLKLETDMYELNLYMLFEGFYMFLIDNKKGLSKILDSIGILEKFDKNYMLDFIYKLKKEIILTKTLR